MNYVYIVFRLGPKLIDSVTVFDTKEAAMEHRRKLAGPHRQQVFMISREVQTTTERQ